MKFNYYPKSDLLYIQIDPNAKEVLNKEVSEGVVLDIGEGGKIVGIEILDASKRMNLGELFPVTYEQVEPASA